jgi:hypothetical protein
MPGRQRFSAFHPSGLRREPARCLRVVPRGLFFGLCDELLDEHGDCLRHK